METYLKPFFYLADVLPSRQTKKCLFFGSFYFPAEDVSVFPHFLLVRGISLERVVLRRNGNIYISKSSLSFPEKSDRKSRNELRSEILSFVEKTLRPRNPASYRIESAPNKNRVSHQTCSFFSLFFWPSRWCPVCRPAIFEAASVWVWRMGSKFFRFLDE